MGLYCNVKDFSIECPKCKRKMEDFQSKDFDDMNDWNFWELTNFYDSCGSCHTWVEFKIYDKPNRQLTIEDYDFTVTYPGKVSQEWHQEDERKIKELFSKESEVQEI